MQPALQMSTAKPYLVAPSKSSGGRYHSVMTLFVNSCELPRLQKEIEKKRENGRRSESVIPAKVCNGREGLGCVDLYRRRQERERKVVAAVLCCCR